MANEYFRFKNFTIRQEKCAMKVGTDGTLLGAWAMGGESILDIGTGTGLVAIMMAQRFSQAVVTAIDIDMDSCMQAKENVKMSPFAERINVVNESIQEFVAVERYDVIVCNPPFFNDSLKCPDSKRTIARHTSTLTYRDLFTGVVRLIKSDGVFSAIIPFDCRSDFEAEAVIAGLFVRRILAVKTTPKKQPRRYLYEFGKHPADCVEQKELVIGSAEYQELTKDFYL